jgi:hypothetical protein
VLSNNLWQHLKMIIYLKFLRKEKGEAMVVDTVLMERTIEIKQVLWGVLIFTCLSLSAIIISQR